MILNWILAFLSAGLLVLVFPRYSFVWLAPVALAPLLIACAREARWQWRVAFGYAAGFFYWFGLCNWIQWTMREHANVGAFVAWILLTLVCLVKAIQMGVFAALAGHLTKRFFGIPATAALWVAIERTHPWTGMEWLNLGNAGSDMSVPLRLAPITGVWGLSFLFALSAAVIAAVAMRRIRLASLWLLPAAGLIFLPEVPTSQKGGATAVVVQPDIDEETVWSGELLHRTEAQLRLLSVSLTPADVVVWPEAPAPFYDFDPVFTALLSDLAKTSGANVLTGVVARGPLNSALLVNPAGATVSRYDKVNLVPFGEFVPWPFGAVANKVSTETGDFVPGTKVVVSPLGAHRIGTFICYEAVFPSYTRQFVAAGAEALFNISNDGWFGRSQARYQHLLIVRMRAAENRRWIVRSTNNGISATIDPAGRVVQALPEYQEAAGRLRFGYRRDLTIYTQYGDWFVALCALVAAAALIVTATVPIAARRSAKESLR